MKQNHSQYCSLDIETSGFDPLKNEILEVGFAFFTVDEKGVTITEEWTKVFKPYGDVPPNILGLTGITREELDAALPFSEYLQELQEKLGGATIVGHNVIFDIKFLESRGIVFSGSVVDTLDLAQFLLPTHHSYNLESLMHLFQVRHAEAHRALPDSKAALVVLERMLRLYHSFSEKLKKNMEELLRRHHLPFADIFKISIPSGPIADNLSKKASEWNRAAEITEFSPRAFRVHSLPVGTNCVESAAVSLRKVRSKVLLVVPRQQYVMDLWRQGLARALFTEEGLFNEQKFTAMLAKDELTKQEVLFLLKILVWQETNWQKECLLDLNLSFSGGQFKEMISGSGLVVEDSEKVLCADYQTFLTFADNKQYTDRLVCFVGLSEFERGVSFGINKKVSWNYVGYALKTIYNPELEVGDGRLKNEVLEGLAATDLFFGLANMLLSGGMEGFQYVKVDSRLVVGEAYQKLTAAAENYIQKLGACNEHLQSKAVGEILNSLQEFFTRQDDRVKWVELSLNRCVFYNSPLSIVGTVSRLLAPYKKTCFVDALGSEKLYKYFVDRLGLTAHKVEAPAVKGLKSGSSSGGQKDLFGLSSLGLNSAAVLPISCGLSQKSLPFNDIISLLGPETLPAAVILGNQLQVKEFYEEYYKNLQEYAFLFAQSASGGSNKIFHNFSIHSNSLLIATGKLVLKFLTSNGNIQGVDNLPVKTLLLCHLPFEQFTHPYQEALAAQYENPFEGFSLPRALYNFHSIFQFFKTPALKTVYICDNKLAKGYSSVFRDYISLIPGIELHNYVPKGVEKYLS